MHPNPIFRQRDEEAALAEAAAIGFAHICLATPDGPAVAHAPVTRHGAALRFHLARANRVTPHLDGARVTLSVAGAHGYITPNWYADPIDRVPSWNYVAIEIDGDVAVLDEAATLAQLDALADTFEPRGLADPPWHRRKTDPAVIARLLRGIRGYEVTVRAVRGTRKLSQHSDAADRAGVIAGLRAVGNPALAALMASGDREGDAGGVEQQRDR